MGGLGGAEVKEKAGAGSWERRDAREVGGGRVLVQEKGTQGGSDVWGRGRRGGHCAWELGGFRGVPILDMGDRGTR